MCFGTTGGINDNMTGNVNVDKALLNMISGEMRVDAPPHGDFEEHDNLYEGR